MRWCDQMTYNHSWKKVTADANEWEDVSGIRKKLKLVETHVESSLEPLVIKPDTVFQELRISDVILEALRKIQHTCQLHSPSTFGCSSDVLSWNFFL